jgi:hypothetical protein
MLQHDCAFVLLDRLTYTLYLSQLKDLIKAKKSEMRYHKGFILNNCNS